MDRMAASRPGGLSSEEVRRKKTSFTLDFGSTTAGQQSSSEAIAAKRAKQELLNEGVLRSPDVGLLALATPDLERLIMQQAYGAAAAVATTPPGAAAATMATTPSQILFPRSVTEEQEAYARGFIDALLELQRQQQNKAALSPHLQVVPDPRTGFFLPLTSPLDDSQASLFTTLGMPRAMPQQPSDSAPKIPLLEFVPTQPMPISVLRPGTLSLPETLSPRRSTLISSFGLKQFPPFTNDCETLDLSPSGRFPMRNLEQSVSSADKKLVQAAVQQSAIDLLDNERPEAASNKTAPLVIDTRCKTPPPESARELPDVETPTSSAEMNVMSSMTTSVMQSGSAANVADDLPFAGQVLPTQPIDMSIQELAKIERKREKNRYAAQKCRLLKLERISRLEKRIAELKQQNDKLSGTSGGLRDQVNQLKQLIVQHVEGGCQIMTVRNLQST